VVEGWGWAGGWQGVCVGGGGTVGGVDLSKSAVTPGLTALVFTYL